MEEQIDKTHISPQFSSRGSEKHFNVENWTNSTWKLLNDWFVQWKHQKELIDFFRWAWLIDWLIGLKGGFRDGSFWRGKKFQPFYKKDSCLLLQNEHRPLAALSCPDSFPLPGVWSRSWRHPSRQPQPVGDAEDLQSAPRSAFRDHKTFLDAQRKTKKWQANVQWKKVDASDSE